VVAFRDCEFAFCCIDCFLQTVRLALEDTVLERLCVWAKV
jgi:hypothetical protein